MSTRGKSSAAPGTARRPSSDGPAYERVAKHVRQMLQSKRVKPGSMLPSERDLASQLGVCHLTVRKGLALLVDQGLIERRIGHGTFAADLPKTGRRHPTTSGSVQPLGQAIALCTQNTKTDMPVMGYAITGVRSVLDPLKFPLEIVGMPAGGCDDQFWPLIGNRVQGLIVQGYLSAADIDALEARGLKYVSVGMLVGRSHAPRVRIDYEDMLTRMIQEAYRFGHVSIGLAHWGPLGVQRAPDWATPPYLEAYRKACRQFNLLDSADRVFTLPPVDRPDWSLVNTAPVLAELDRLPTLLIVQDEVMAMALARDLEVRGIHIPQDISMVCMFDSTPNAHRVPLSGCDARQEHAAIFRKAAQLMQAQIEGPPLQSTEVRHQCTVHFKASLAPARRSTPI